VGFHRVFKVILEPDESTFPYTLPVPMFQLTRDMGRSQMIRIAGLSRRRATAKSTAGPSTPVAAATCAQDDKAFCETWSRRLAGSI
jgi:hypothetical protein